MGTEAFTRKIGNVVISVTRFHVMKAFNLQVKLGGIFGSTLGALIQGASLEDSTDKAEQAKSMQSIINNLPTAIRTLFEALPEDQWENLIKELLDKAEVQFTENGTSKRLPLGGGISEKDWHNNMDKAFAGCAENIFVACAFVLEVNYPNLIGGITKRLGNLSLTSIFGQQNEDATS